MLELKPMKHQLEGARICMSQRSTLVAFEVGCGKSNVAIACLDRYEKNLIVCPASLVANWNTELDLWLGDSRKDYNIEVKSYNRINFSDKAHTIIFDEAHLMKNRESNRSCYSKSVAKKTQRVILLTATPVINRPEELYVLLDIMGIKCDVAPEAIYEYLTSNNIMLRVRADDVLDLKGANYYDKAIQLTNVRQIIDIQEQIKHIYSLKDNDLEDTWSDYRMELVGLLARIRRHVGVAKVAGTIEAINEHLQNKPNEPLIVFAHHKLVLETIAETFGAPLLYGKTGLSKRNKIVQEFQNGEHQIVVCSILAAGVGLTLTKSHHMIFVERDWTFASYIQAVGRSLRKGQEHEVQVLNLISDHPVDTRQSELLEEKQSISDLMTDGNKNMNVHVLQKKIIESILEL